MILFKQFTFDAAHFLPMVPTGHKCREMHGHTYRLTVFIDAPLDPKLGWVMDFTDLKQIVNDTIDIVDHSLLNNIPGLENPTCELLAVWIWNRIKHLLPQLTKIELWETPTSGVVYEGN